MRDHINEYKPKSEKLKVENFNKNYDNLVQ